jgi:O-acetyl-ADP-ribose deacetylase (regulator of RNase III)
MIRFAQGNLLDADAEALVNTVNTVGVMGKGIALMFKDAFPQNFRAYAAACKAGEVEVGRMFVTERGGLGPGPRWIVNFPTKMHWRNPSRLAWIEAGLADLVAVIESLGIRSIALPPLGSGNGGLPWEAVRSRIEVASASLPEVDIVIYEPSGTYRNGAKRAGVERLTPSRALVAELIRRYGTMGLDCSLLEAQKLAYFAERACGTIQLPDTFDFGFEPGPYGPYAEPLRHMLDQMDGSYLHCDKRIADAEPLDAIWFDDSRRKNLEHFLAIQDPALGPALALASDIIDGFESPLGLELLATVDWLVVHQNVEPTLPAVLAGLAHWPHSASAAERKLRLFDERLIALALHRLFPIPVGSSLPS